MQVAAVKRKMTIPDGIVIFLVEEGGFEPPKRNATDLQSNTKIVWQLRRSHSTKYN